MTRTEPWRCEMCDEPSSLCQCENGPWNDIDEAFEYLKGERRRLRAALDSIASAPAIDRRNPKAWALKVMAMGALLKGDT